MACPRGMPSAQSKTGLGRQRPVHGSDRVVLSVNGRAVLGRGGASAEGVAQAEPEPANERNDVDHFGHGPGAPVVLFEHRSVVVNDGDAEAALAKRPTDGLTGVLEVEIKRGAENKPVHDKLGRVAPAFGGQFVVEQALKQSEVGEKAEHDADEHHVEHEGEDALPGRGDEHALGGGTDDVLRQRAALDDGHRVFGHGFGDDFPFVKWRVGSITNCA